MPEFAWSTDIDNDIVTVIEAVIAAADPAVQSAAVYDGRAVKGAVPPFVTCWHLGPTRDGIGLATEAWGIAHQEWQISAHGVTQAQARYLAEQVCGYGSWPAGWDLVEIGPMIEDVTDDPPTWFFPLTFRYQNT